MNYLKRIATTVLLVGCMAVGQIASAQVPLTPGTSVGPVNSGYDSMDYPGGTIPWTEWLTLYFPASPAWTASSNSASRSVRPRSIS